VQRFEDPNQHAIDIIHDFHVAEPDCREASRTQKRVSPAIVLGLVGPAIDFHDQCFRGAKEVRDKRWNRDLPTKFEAT
jgi:hypothetical protein